MRRRSTPIPADSAVVGIDIAKRSFVAVAQAGDGTVTKPRTFPNSRDGFQSFLAWANERPSWVAALEPTGHYGAPLSNWLHDEGVAVFQVEPLLTKRAKELGDGTRRKTDAKDAAVVAELCRRGICRPFAPLEPPFSELRVLCRHREQLVKRRAQLQNRLHWQLDVVFPEVVPLFQRIDSAACLRLVELAPTPADVLAMEPEVLLQELRRASRGAHGVELVERLRVVAEGSIGVTRDQAARRRAIRQIVDEMASVRARLQEIEADMKACMRQVDYAPRMLSVPLLGELTVAILLAEFGDFRNYKVAKQLIAMAGLDLVEHSSGERRGHRSISRRGRRYARQILYMAVLRLGWTVLSEPRRRLVEENKVAPSKAAIANMSRLLRILHALVRDDVDFDPALHGPKEAESMVA
jgi:transposase